MGLPRKRPTQSVLLAPGGRVQLSSMALELQNQKMQTFEPDLEHQPAPGSAEEAGVDPGVDSEKDKEALLIVLQSKGAFWLKYST